MRTLAFFKKTLLENLREWKILSLSLVFAPFFVYVMYGYFHASPTTYTLLVKNHDGAGSVASGSGRPAAEDLTAAWKEAARADGSRVFKVVEIQSIDEAIRQLMKREADVLVEIPAGFSASVEALRNGRAVTPPLLTNRVNQANLRSTMAMAFSDYVAFQYAFVAARTLPPLLVTVEQVGSSRELSEFEMYMPALLVLALIMVMFTAAASLIKEVDKGTMSRLMLSKLSTAELLAAVSLSQVIIGTATLLLAYLAGVSVGYEPRGSLAAVLLVAAVSTVAVVAISVLVAAFLRTIFELLTVGCFPFFILMFFSDAMFPLPKIPVFRVAGHVVNATDILPTSLTVRAFSAILNDGASLGGVQFELAGIVVLAAVYFAIGIWLFRRRHMRVA